MNKKMKGILIGIGVVIIIAILVGAYFASQPKVKWWKPEKPLEKPSIDFSKLNSTVVFLRTAKDNKSMNLVGGNESGDGIFGVYIYFDINHYIFVQGDFDEIRANFIAWAERLSRDYILQKLAISYKYGSEKEYNFTGIEYTDTSDFEGTHLYFNLAKNHDPHEDDLWWNWYTMHKMTGVNKDKKDADFYGVSFPIEIFLDDSLSLHLTHTITFTVTAYYGHPSLLGWSDMHELKTQVVLKIVPGGEKE